MERRAELVEQSVARSREVGAMYLDSTQQRIFAAMLEAQSERARAEVVSFFRPSGKQSKSRSRSALARHAVH